MTVHVLGTPNPDSTISFPKRLEFQVGPPCGNPPPACVERELETTVPTGECAVTLAPGTGGDVPLLYTSPLAMGGLQGNIQVAPPFRLAGLHVASSLSGVHLSWTQVDRGARWLVFTDPGVVLPAGEQMPLLNATVAADTGALEMMNLAAEIGPSEDYMPWFMSGEQEVPWWAAGDCLWG